MTAFSRNLPLFVPEGHIDKALTRALIVYRRDFDTFTSRKQGISGVATEMQRQWDVFGLERRIVGMVDADKKFSNVRYLAEFNHEIGSYQAAEASHTIRQHPARPSQYLIVLQPACDTWVWQAAVLAGLRLGAYGLPAERREFVSYSKNKGKAIGADPPVLQLLLDIQRARPALFATLASFVAQIMDLSSPLS